MDALQHFPCQGMIQFCLLVADPALASHARIFNGCVVDIYDQHGGLDFEFVPLLCVFVCVHVKKSVDNLLSQKLEQHVCHGLRLFQMRAMTRAFHISQRTVWQCLSELLGVAG